MGSPIPIVRFGVINMLKVTEKGKTVYVTDTDFAFVRELIGDSKRAHSFAKGGRFNGFENLYKDWGSPNEAFSFNSKLALANFITALRIWREAIAGINNYMKNQANNPNVRYVAKVYGLEWKDCADSEQSEEEDSNEENQG